MTFDDFILRSALQVKNIDIVNRVRHALRLNDLDMARSVLSSKVSITDVAGHALTQRSQSRAKTCKSV